MKIVALRSVAAVLLLMSLAEPLNQGAEAFPVTCCMKTSEIKVRKEQLKSYSVQDKPLCPVKAVRFVTDKDITVCSDPSTPWAINTISFLENRGAQQGNNTTPFNV